MKFGRWSVAVQALVQAIPVALFVASVMPTAGCVSTRAVSAERQVILPAFPHVVYESFDRATFVDVDLHTAVQTREAVEYEFRAAYGKPGHPRWFFHAFDREHLDFVVARYAVSDPRMPRYVAERTLRVKRTREAERALGVLETIRERERASRAATPARSSGAR